MMMIKKMMNYSKILIKSISKEGQIALLEEWLNDIEPNKQNKIAMKLANYEAKIETENPFSISIKMKSKILLQPNFFDLFRNNIIKSIEKHNVELEKDFTFELVE